MSRVVAMTLACSTLGAPVFAQSTQATIVGTVTDASGAVVPNATITVTNTDANVTRVVTTDASGNYQILDLAAGHYRVQIAASGFSTEEETNLLLVARQQLRANAKLQVSSVAQEVTVDSQAAGAIDSETPSIASTLTSEDVQSLPANYRASQQGTSPLNLIQTLPGVQTGTGGTSPTNPVQFSVQGGLPSQTDVTVDGITSQNTTSNSPIVNAFPSGESISELRVDGVLNNAEFGQPGEVTSISKSGTNALHGAAFWYFQNSAFNAVPFGASAKPKVVGNDFGGTAGGPVVIPHFYNGHDKTFFFGTYEGFRLPNQTPYQAIVPTVAMKQGNFSQVTTTPLTNPIGGGTYTNFTVPVNAASQKFLQFFPDPNFGDTNSINSINYSSNKDTSYSSNQFDVRGDEYLGQKALIFGRFTFKNINQNLPEALAVPSGTEQTQERILVVAGNYSFTPKILNEFRFGFTLDTEGSANSFDGPSFAQSTGLQGLQNLFFNGGV